MESQDTKGRKPLIIFLPNHEQWDEFRSILITIYSNAKCFITYWDMNKQNFIEEQFPNELIISRLIQVGLFEVYCNYIVA